MLGTKVAVCAALLAALIVFKSAIRGALSGLSDARVSLKFMIALLAVMLPSSVVIFTTNLRATSNIITVNNLTDPGSTPGNGFCTLREAINNANAKSDTSGGDCAAGTGNDTILFSVSGKITLAAGALPAIANSSPGSLTIDGTGQTITVDGANSFAVLAVNEFATLNLNLLTIAHGKTSFEGGGINNSPGGMLTVTNSTFTANNAGEGGAIGNAGTLMVIGSTFSANGAVSENGGGIFNDGTLTVTNSTFSSNSASAGGGIFSEGTLATLTITNSTFTANNSVGQGGGIYNNGALTVTNSTFSSNSASNGTVTSNGGGIYNAGTLTVTNSIFSSNHAAVGSYGGGFGGAILNTDKLTIINSTFANDSGDEGGGIFNFGTLTVSNSTFVGNSASSGLGGGIFNYNTLANTATITNSILANVLSGSNCAGLTTPTVTNGGRNVSDDASCGFGTSTAANGDTIGDSVSDSNVALDPDGLANNGGPTETIALESGSFAIDAVPLAHACPATDQRGAQRPDPNGSGTACDIGAFEFDAVIPSPTPTATPTATGTANATRTATSTATASATSTATATGAATPTATATGTATATATAAATMTATPTSTPTPVAVTLKISPKALKFSKTTVGTPSKPKTVKVSNPKGNSKHPGLPVLIEMISDPPVFTETNTCPPSLAAGASCSVTVTFTPNAAGAQTGTLTITDNAKGSTQTVSLSGLGK